jgi:3-phosphoshikimate 1-carboxyvinyltransferase
MEKVSGSSEGKKIFRQIHAPASKSYMQRALAVALFAEGESVLEHISWCDDSLAAKAIIEQLGAETEEQGRMLKVRSHGVTFGKTEFSAGEAGLSIRMFSPVLALSDRTVTFTGKGSLLKRPVASLRMHCGSLALK